MIGVLGYSLSTFWQYYIIFIWSILSFFILYFSNTKAIKEIYFLSNYIPMALLLGFRDKSVGTDTRSYIYMLGEAIKSDDLIRLKVGGLESGFVIIGKVLSSVGLEVDTILALITIFTIISIGYFLYKYSKNFYVSTIAFISIDVFLHIMNLSRQYLSISILIWSIAYLVNNKKSHAIVISTIASLIHVTSFVFIPIILLYPYSMKKIAGIIGVSVLVICIMQLSGVQEYIEILKFFSYDHYLLSKEVSEGITLQIEYIAFLLVLLYMLCLYKKYTLIHSYKDNQMYLFMIIVLIELISIHMLTVSIPLIDRLHHSFSIFLCLLIPILIDSVSMYIKSKYVFIWMYVGIIIIFFIRYTKSLYLGENVSGYVYSTFLW